MVEWGQEFSLVMTGWVWSSVPGETTALPLLLSGNWTKHKERPPLNWSEFMGCPHQVNALKDAKTKEPLM